MSATKSRIITWSLIGTAVTLVISFVGGMVLGYLDGSGVNLDFEQIIFWVAAVFAVIVMTGSMVIGTLWMRSIDEAAQEAHKSAWYWGGCTGMAAGGVVLILAALPGAAGLEFPALWMGRTDPAAYAAAGAFGMLSLMLIGYTSAWAWWWWAKR